MKKTTSRFTFPYVTVEQAVAYNPEKPETATEARIVNAVVEAIPTVRPLTPRTIAESIGVDSPAISGAIKCATGLSLVKFLEEWRVQKLLTLSEEERNQRSDEIARQLGFYDRSSLWEFMKRKRLIKLIRSGSWCDPSLYKNTIFASKKKRK